MSLAACQGVRGKDGHSSRARSIARIPHAAPRAMVDSLGRKHRLSAYSSCDKCKPILQVDPVSTSIALGDILRRYCEAK